MLLLLFLKPSETFIDEMIRSQNHQVGAVGIDGIRTAMMAIALELVKIY